MTSIIIDDELHCREVLQLLLELHCPQVQILALCANSAEGLLAIKTHQPQLVFLDIEMPGGNAFDMLSELNELNFQIIFTTAYDQYAIRAIKYSALDYLLKPIDGNELAEAIDKASKNSNTTQQLQLQQLQASLLQPKDDFKLIIATSEGSFFIAPSDILYCEGQSNYTHFHLTRDRKMISSKTLLEYETLLAQQHFFRVHKSYLVNLKHVEAYKNVTGTVLLNTGKQVEVSRRRKEALLNLLFNK
jgi:two-component system LytT family response regulator